MVVRVLNRRELMKVNGDNKGQRRYVAVHGGNAGARILQT